MTTELGQRLLPVSRRTQVLQAVERAGAIRVSDLVTEMGVSPVTIRRDIARLSEEGLVERVHGGARSVARPAAAARVEPPPPTAETLIGMLVPSLDYYWPDVVQGAQEAASAHGMGISLQGSSYTNDDERPQLRRLVQAHEVAGLIAAPNVGSPHGAEITEWLTHCGLPVVLTERTAERAPRGEALESVITDHAGGAAVAVRYLAELGHRRVGLVTSEHSPTSKHVRAGWEEVGREHPALIEGAVVVQLPDRLSSGWNDALDAVVQQCLSTGTTALLVHSDPEAMAVVERCERFGVPVPGRLSVIAYDDEVAGLFNPALTAVQPSRRSVGAAAVRLLADRLADPGRPVHQVTISPKLHIRASTAPPA